MFAAMLFFGLGLFVWIAIIAFAVAVADKEDARLPQYRPRRKD